MPMSVSNIRSKDGDKTACRYDGYHRNNITIETAMLWCDTNPIREAN